MRSRRAHPDRLGAGRGSADDRQVRLDIGALDAVCLTRN
jgi:hypothetical protein